LKYPPYFSIIIATYNRADLLPRAVNSVLDQSFDHWELLIVDDGSTDDTEAVVKGLGDARIRYFYKENEEKSIARNFGMERAKGKYLCFLDDDDYYLPAFLESMYVEIQKHQEKKALFRCGEYIQKANGKRVKEYTPTKYLDKPLRFLWEMQSSIRPFAIHRELYLQEFFHETCRFGQDFHLLIRLALKHSFFYSPEFLSVNVLHGKRATNQKFVVDLNINAWSSIHCIEDLIQKGGSELQGQIPKRELTNLVNHKVYAFASAAMKSGNAKLYKELLKKFSFKASIFITFYRYLSLQLRFPFYFLKNKIYAS
jgi:glycosyltransferase involved in cell wall biosynthesis